ncbi:pyridoxal phosphate-dependent decarboxylase family protein [Nocardioides sp. GXQ0305]|uniref:pyridoxal phosphate-dependent decarboxylase family protein n=1 Tax=Nocardioides sp. GXQ0305 TaxID=3423912 RepID=UPI003D7D1026
MSTPPPLHHLFHPAHAAAYADAMHAGVDRLTEALVGATRPATGRSPEAAERLVRRIDLDRPLGDANEALAEMGRIWLDDAVWFHDPGYAAHLNCPVVLPAVLAELFVSGVNPSLDTFDQSVGGTFVERHLVDWTAGRVGLGPDADGVFTSGGTQSNLQALLLAREVAREHHPGLDAGRMRIVASQEAHFSVQTSARLLGLDDDAVVGVATDHHRRMDPDALATALARIVAAGDVPVAVVATAGTTDFGAIDPLPAVAGLCRSFGTWLHVDAAYGGGLLASQRLRPRLAGIERADSVTVDFHKTWFQPVSCSALVVRDRRRLRHVTWRADYLNPRVSHGTQPPHQVDKSLQTTRRFDALKLWMTLRVMGADVVGSYVEHVVDLAREVGDLLADHPDLELAARPQLSTVVFRHRRGAPADEVRARLYDGGTALVAATTVDGERWLKLTLLNPAAELGDVRRLLDRVAAEGDDLLDEDEAVAS